MNNLHATQLAYIAAKTAYQIANEEADRRMKPYEHLLDQNTDEAVDKFTDIETGIEEELGVWKLFDELKAAENALIEWAVGQIKQQSIATPYLEDIEAVYQAAISGGRPKVRAQVIDLCARLGS